MTRQPSVRLSRAALDRALVHRRRPVLTPEARGVLAEQLDAIVAHYPRWDLRGPRRQAAHFAETIAAHLAALDRTIALRARALTRRTATGAVVGVSPETVFALHTQTWQRTIAQWRAATAQEDDHWRRPAHRMHEAPWLSTAEDVLLVLTEAGVPITTSDTGVYVRVLRLIAEACGRAGDVRTTARTVVQARREAGTTTGKL